MSDTQETRPELCSDTPMDDNTTPATGPTPDTAPGNPEQPSGESRAGASGGETQPAHARIGETVGNLLHDMKIEPRASIGVLDRLLDWTRRTFPADLLDRYSARAVTYGHAGICAAQVLTVLFGLVVALKTGQWIFIAYGIGLALLLVIIQYTAGKFIDAGRNLVARSPSKLGSSGFLDCLALLLEVSGLIALLTLMGTQGVTGAVVGIGFWALCDTVAFVALHPALANVRIDPDISAAEEAIGIMSFFVKAMVRIVPAAFGIGAVIGSVALLVGTISLIGTASALPGMMALQFLILCACLPFAGYVVFVFYHLLLDLLRAILSLPGGRAE